MAATGTATVDVQLTGSAIRLRTLELALDSTKETMFSGRPATPEIIIERAKRFEEYVTGKTA